MPAVTLTTIESHNHIIGDIERGVKVYRQGGIEFEEYEPNYYLARVPHKQDKKTVAVTFSHNGQDIEHHHCDCTWTYKEPPVCRHVVAAILAIQGGIAETKLTVGMTASVSDAVSSANTANTVGSGSLEVSTPMMTALMERAACECLAGCLDDGQTSVGSAISVEHSAASPLGATITATAKIAAVFGRRIEFELSARDGAGEIGKGRHTRVIVDAGRFMKKAETRL